MKIEFLAGTFADILEHGLSNLIGGFWVEGPLKIVPLNLFGKSDIFALFSLLFPCLSAWASADVEISTGAALSSAATVAPALAGPRDLL